MQINNHRPVQTNKTTKSMSSNIQNTRMSQRTLNSISNPYDCFDFSRYIVFLRRIATYRAPLHTDIPTKSKKCF